MTTADWLNPLIAGLHGGQAMLLQTLDALGLVDRIGGQPAWPFAWRLSGENLLIDTPQARRLALSLLALVAALVLAVIAIGWRRRHWSLLALSAALLVVAPRPDPQVVLVAAHPSSFHRSTTAFSAPAIVAGRPVYATQCASCHGDNGRGDGPLARQQTVWPPDFAGPLLWRRADGELFWHIREGLADRRGQPTMPGFKPALDDTAIWQVIDYLKAQSAGQSLRVTGAWLNPVALPAATIDCPEQTARSDQRPWRGQRLRVVALDAGQPLPVEDPRLITVALSKPLDEGALRAPTADLAPNTSPLPNAQSKPNGQASPTAQAVPSAAPASTTEALTRCAMRDRDAWTALTLITGGTALPGRQLIVDRDGWLRAISAPGNRDWSIDDLVCRSGSPTAPPGESSSANNAAGVDPIGRLIATIDADPVRFVKGGLVH